MAALHDGERFLIERYSMAVVPGLNLVEPRALPQGLPRDQIDLLLGGLSESVQDFPALPHVRDELEAIRLEFGGSLLLDQQFRSAVISDALERTPYSIVHLASHAQFGGSSDETFLLTFDGRLSLDGLERMIKYSQFRDQPVELLTLSACQTAVGDERAGLGLAGVGIKAGARSALATLWFVNDQASARLVAGFYHGLGQAGTSKAAALRQAQLDLLADEAYRHPAFWSPFLLIGNWL